MLMADWHHRLMNLFSTSGAQVGGDMPSLEIHVPISPTGQFFTMVRLLAASLQANGGEMADTPIVVTVGEDCEPFDLYAAQPWSRRYPIKWVWLDRNLYRSKTYYATAVERFRHEFEAEVVVMLDADMVVARPFGDLVRKVARERFFGGVIAHVSPFSQHAAHTNTGWWHTLFSNAGLPWPEAQFQHTGWNLLFSAASSRYCPAYFNLGFLIAPAEHMRKVGASIYDAMNQVDQTLETMFKCQLGLTLALYRHGIPVRPLPIKYNFPNYEVFRKGYAADFADSRVIHYLGRDQFDKSRDLQSLESLGRWLSQGRLTKTNQMLRGELRKAYKSINQTGQ
jgi:hypothetical protein